MLLVVFFLGISTFIPFINRYAHFMGNLFFTGVTTVIMTLTASSVIAVCLSLFITNKIEQKGETCD